MALTFVRVLLVCFGKVEVILCSFVFAEVHVTVLGLLRDNFQCPQCQWFSTAVYALDCSLSSIFLCDRLDILRLTITGILICKCTNGAGVGDYNSERRVGGGGGGGGGIKI